MLLTFFINIFLFLLSNIFMMLHGLKITVNYWLLVLHVLLTYQKYVLKHTYILMYIQMLQHILTQNI